MQLRAHMHCECVHRKGWNADVFLSKCFSLVLFSFCMIHNYSAVVPLLVTLLRPVPISFCDNRRTAGGPDIKGQTRRSRSCGLSLWVVSLTGRRGIYSLSEDRFCVEFEEPLASRKGALATCFPRTQNFRKRPSYHVSGQHYLEEVNVLHTAVRASAVRTRAHRLDLLCVSRRSHSSSQTRSPGGDHSCYVL